MSETLTKDEIEAFFTVVRIAQQYHDSKAKAPGSPGEVALYEKLFDGVKALALQAIDMRPRPLAEIDKTDTALVIERDPYSYGVNIFVLNCYGSGHWKRSPASQAWLPSSLAIPLSTLPTGGE